LRRPLRLEQSDVVEMRVEGEVDAMRVGETYLPSRNPWVAAVLLSHKLPPHLDLRHHTPVGLDPRQPPQRARGPVIYPPGVFHSLEPYARDGDP
jgi:hypothetical protein